MRIELCDISLTADGPQCATYVVIDPTYLDVPILSVVTKYRSSHLSPVLTYDFSS